MKKGKQKRTDHGPLPNSTLYILVGTIVAIIFAPYYVDKAYEIGKTVTVFHLTFSRAEILNNFSSALVALSALFMGLLSFTIARQSNDISKRLLEIEMDKRMPTIMDAKQGKPFDIYEVEASSMRRMTVQFGPRRGSEFEYVVYVEFLNDSLNTVTNCSVKSGRTSCGNYYSDLDSEESRDLSVSPGNRFTVGISINNTIPYIRETMKEPRQVATQSILVVHLVMDVYAGSVKNTYTLLLNQFPTDKGGLLIPSLQQGKVQIEDE